MTGVPRRNTEQPALAAERLRAQLLSGVPAGTVAGVTGHLLAVQAQDSRGMRLAVRARTSGLLATHVDEALTADRSVVVSWLNRGTLHLVLAEDYWWLHQLTTPQLAAGNKRRLAQEGVPPQDAERGVRVIERSLAADGPLTRAELRERIAAAGVRTQGQAIVQSERNRAPQDRTPGAGVRPGDEQDPARTADHGPARRGPQPPGG